jgi:hypothetical protein
LAPLPTSRRKTSQEIRKRDNPMVERKTESRSLELKASLKTRIFQEAGLSNRTISLVISLPIEWIHTGWTNLISHNTKAIKPQRRIGRSLSGPISVWEISIQGLWINMPQATVKNRSPIIKGATQWVLETPLILLM